MAPHFTNCEIIKSLKSFFELLVRMRFGKMTVQRYKKKMKIKKNSYLCKK